LADEGVAVDLAAEMGLVGYWPVAGEPMLFNQRNFPTCTMLADIDFTMSVLVAGGPARSIGAPGAARLDRRGTINSTIVPGMGLGAPSGPRSPAGGRADATGAPDAPSDGPARLVPDLSSARPRAMLRPA